MAIKDSIQILLENFRDALMDVGSLHLNQLDEENINRVLAQLDGLLQLAAQSYELNRKIVQNLIGHLTDAVSVGRAVLLYRIHSRFFDSINVMKRTGTPDYMPAIPEECRDRVVEKCKGLLANLPLKTDLTCMNEMVMAHLTDEEAKWMQSYVGDLMEYQSHVLCMDKCAIENGIVMLALLRALTVRNRQREFFYLVMLQWVASLSKAHWYQTARDMAETALMMGLDDGLEEYGFLVAARTYTTNNDAVGGLLFYNLMMDAVGRKKCGTRKMLYEILWQQVMTLRTAGWFNAEYRECLVSLFDSMHFDDYEHDSFHHSLLGMDLLNKSKGLPAKLKSYLNERSEKILQQGEYGIVPWFISLLQVFEVYEREETEPLEKFLKEFDRAVPNKSVMQSWMDSILKRNLSTLLKEEMCRLDATRYLHNFNTDAWYASVLACKLLDEAFEKRSYADFVLAMLFRSDYGFIFPERPCPGLRHKLEVNDMKAGDMGMLYDTIEGIRSAVQTEGMDEMLWIGCGMKSVYGFSMVKDAFAFEEYGKWDLECLKKLNLFEPFSTQTTDLKGKPIVKVEEDYRAEYEELHRKMERFAIAVSSDEGSACCVVKDCELAFLPHQLLVDKISGRFLGELKPSAHVLSTEVMMGSLLNEMLKKGYEKSFWCPVEGDQGASDFALQMQYNKLEEWLVKENFKIFGQTYPEHPLCSEVNVICAHGGCEIGHEQCFYAGSRPIREVDRIVGHGKLLVLLICHSGSMKTNPGYDVSVHSLVKKFIRKGYAAIVAPMWSLSIDITRPWMEVFFRCMDEGTNVCEAVFAANMNIRSIYGSPRAWACMHLFGNPYLTVN